MGSALFLTFWVQLICSMSLDPWGWAELTHLPFPRPTPLSPVCPGHVSLLQCHLSPLSKQTEHSAVTTRLCNGRAGPWGQVGKRRWKGTPRLAPLSPHPGASPPSPLCPGSSFSVYANPTNQSTHLHPRPPGWLCPRASRDECGWDGLWEGERAWGASGSPDCVGEMERGGSWGEPRACLRRVP